LFAKRNESVATIQQASENGGQLDNQVARGVGVEADERRDGVESVEEEMRINLVLQGLHAGIEQEALLLFEFDLNADAVPNFELGADHHNRSGIDQRLYPQLRTFECVG